MGALLVGAVLATGACRDDAEPTRPSAQPQTSDFQQTALTTVGDPLIAYARQIPGFGGFFLDRNGVPTVYLKDPSQRATAEQVLGGVVREFGYTPSQMRVLKGDYDYLQLATWHGRALSRVFAVGAHRSG